MDKLELIELSKRYDIENMVCDLSALFKDIVVLESKSRSRTVQLFAKIDPSKTQAILKEYLEKTHQDEVFIKIGFNPIQNSDDIERFIYKYTLSLIKEHRTPNLMRYIMSFKCPNYYDSASPEIKERMKEMDVEIMESHNIYGSITRKKANFIVLEKGVGSTFNDLIKSEVKLTDNDLLSISFQIAYTIRELSMAGVRHNDIHLNNIWINILPVVEDYIYITSINKYYVLPIKYLVKIYDYDLATFTVKDAPINTELTTRCPKYGQCSTPTELFDLHYFLFRLYKLKPIYPIVSRICSAFITDRNLLNDSCCRAIGRLCKIIEETGECDPLYEPSGMRGFTRALRTNVFDLFKKERLEKWQLPTETILPEDSIPDMVLPPNFYVSANTEKTAIQMANILLG